MSGKTGIILRLNPYREADYIAVILTDEFGKIDCLARSARRSKHRFFSGLQILDYGNFIFSKSKKNLVIDSISNKQSFNEIGNQPSNFVLASLFCEILDKMVPEGDQEYAILIPFFMRTLKGLTRAQSPTEQICFSTWFICKLACISGIDPSASTKVFRSDDLKWISSLTNDELLKYEPFEASLRAFLRLLEFVESNFDFKLKTKPQLLGKSIF